MLARKRERIPDCYCYIHSSRGLTDGNIERRSIREKPVLLGRRYLHVYRVFYCRNIWSEVSNLADAARKKRAAATMSFKLQMLSRNVSAVGNCRID